MTRRTAPLLGPEPAEVGRYYSVPCAFVRPEYRTKWMPNDGWLPVLGPKHEDSAYLNFRRMHYHVDWRFISDYKFAFASIGLRCGAEFSNVLTSATGRDEITGTELRKKKCHRAMPDFPALHGDKWHHLQAAHQCVRLKPGGICPHRGIDLRPFEQPDGTAICPGHGLRWNLTTGELIPRHMPGRKTGVK